MKILTFLIRIFKCPFRIRWAPYPSDILENCANYWRRDLPYKLTNGLPFEAWLLARKVRAIEHELKRRKSESGFTIIETMIVISIIIIVAWAFIGFLNMDPKVADCMRKCSPGDYSYNDQTKACECKSSHQHNIFIYK